MPSNCMKTKQQSKWDRNIHTQSYIIIMYMHLQTKQYIGMQQRVTQLTSVFFVILFRISYFVFTLFGTKSKLTTSCLVCSSKISHPDCNCIFVHLREYLVPQQLFARIYVCVLRTIIFSKATYYGINMTYKLILSLSNY